MLFLQNLDPAILQLIIGIFVGWASFGSFLFVWLGIFDPWIRRRRVRAYMQHVDRQYDRQKLIHKLKVTIATTNDIATIRAAQYQLRYLEAHQQLSHEVWPALHPPSPQKRHE